MLNDDCFATLMHAFITSRIDYCISLLAGAPETSTDKLQRVMNAAARIISNTRKFDRGLTQLRRDLLHWLDVTDRITFRLCVHVFLCGCVTLHGMAPSCLSELCRLVSEFEGRRHLRSSDHSQLDVPHYRLATIGRGAFGYAGPKAWNSLPDYLRCSDLSLETFKRQLKTFVFAHY